LLIGRAEADLSASRTRRTGWTPGFLRTLDKRGPWFPRWTVLPARDTGDDGDEGAVVTMGDIGTERREVEFEPLPEDPLPEPRPVREPAAPLPAPDRT